MDALQFSLFFIALLVGYVLVHLRLVRFEEHLQKLAGIRGLDDRLRALDDRLRVLTEVVEKVGFDRVERQLDRLHIDLEDLRETTGSVRQAVVEIPTPAVARAAVAIPGDVVVPAASSQRQRVLDAVETRLLQLGYREVRVLSELDGVGRDGDVELQVECERGNMPAKGRVLLRNGSVRDVSIQTVATMFP
jgi:hypothetical protein